MPRTDAEKRWHRTASGLYIGAVALSIACGVWSGWDSESRYDSFDQLTRQGGWGTVDRELLGEAGPAIALSYVYTVVSWTFVTAMLLGTSPAKSRWPGRFG